MLSDGVVCKQTVSAAWRNWKTCCGVSWDRRMPVKLKKTIYITVVRSAMLYAADTWTTINGQEARIEMTETKMLRWMCGVTKKVTIRNEYLRGTTRVTQASKMITEKQLK